MSFMLTNNKDKFQRIGILIIILTSTRVHKSLYELPSVSRIINAMRNKPRISRNSKCTINTKLETFLINYLILQDKFFHTNYAIDGNSGLNTRNTLLKLKISVL